MHHGDKKTVLLTGGNGFLGHNTLKLLAADERYKVVAPVRDIRLPVAQLLAHKVHFIQLDLADPVMTARVLASTEPEIIVHCAATGLKRSTPDTRSDLIKFNAACTMGLFNMCCQLSHPSHFIYISTGLVYRSQDRPLTEEDPLGTQHPYGASKAFADIMLQRAAAISKRRLTILRPFAFTGKYDRADRLFPLILQAAVEGKRQPLSLGTQIRDFCSVNDIAFAITLAMERKQLCPLEIFNLGSGLSMPLRQVIEMVCQELNLKPSLAYGESPMHPFEPKHAVANITRAEELLGWKPRTGVTYAVWELAQQVALTLNLKRPDRDYGLA